MKPRCLSNWPSVAVMYFFSSSCLWNLGIQGALREAEELALSEESPLLLSSGRFVSHSPEDAPTKYSSPKSLFTFTSVNSRKQSQGYVKSGEALIAPDNSKPARLWPSSTQRTLRRFKGAVSNVLERLQFAKPTKPQNVDEIHGHWNPEMLITNDAQAENYVEKFDPIYFSNYLSKKTYRSVKTPKNFKSLEFLSELAGKDVNKFTPRELMLRLKILEPVFRITEGNEDAKIIAILDATKPQVLIPSTTKKDGRMVEEAMKAKYTSSKKLHPITGDATIPEPMASQSAASVIEQERIRVKKLWEDDRKLFQIKLGSVHSLVLRLPKDFRENSDLTDAIHQVYSLIWWRNAFNHPEISLLAKRLNKEFNMKLPVKAQKDLGKPEIFYDL